MSVIAYLAGPVVGAVIGYLTNDLAIRMLFRPHKAKHVLGVHVPFTPGIIPKEKNRIAQSIGQAVANNLMNQEVLEKTLLSDEMLAKIEQAIDEFVVTQSANDETLREFAGHYLGDGGVDTIRSQVADSVVKQITAKLEDTSLGQQIARMATEHVLEKTRNSLAGRLGAENVVALLTRPVERQLARHINEILHNNAHDMAIRIVGQESDKLMNLKMSELTTGHDEQLAQIKSGLLSAYRSVIADHLPRILRDLNIGAIIENRINDMDMTEAEAVIMQVIKKELKAIVWLGALLGFVIGSVNTFL